MGQRVFARTNVALAWSREEDAGIATFRPVERAAAVRPAPWQLFFAEVGRSSDAPLAQGAGPLAGLGFEAELGGLGAVAPADFAGELAGLAQGAGLNAHEGAGGRGAGQQ